MIETIFATMLFASVAVGLIQVIVIIQKGLNSVSPSNQERITAIESNLNDLFLPVEDLEWAVSQVLP